MVNLRKYFSLYNTGKIQIINVLELSEFPYKLRMNNNLDSFINIANLIQIDKINKRVVRRSNGPNKKCYEQDLYTMELHFHDHVSTRF